MAGRSAKLGYARNAARTRSALAANEGVLGQSRGQSRGLDRVADRLLVLLLELDDGLTGDDSPDRRDQAVRRNAFRYESPGTV